MRRSVLIAGVVSVLVAAQLFTSSNRLHGQVRVQRVAAVTPGDLRGWDARVDQMARDAQLQRLSADADLLLPGRRHERFQQFYRGLPIWGGDVSRQAEGGLTVSIFGTIYESVNVSTAPVLTPQDVRDVVRRLVGVDAQREPELVILPLDGGGYALTYRVPAIGPDDASMYFIDALDGSVRLKYSLFENQSAVVQGTGLLGQTQKVSVHAISGTYTADDQLRPPALQTFDMQGNFNAAVGALFSGATLTSANLAQNPSVNWSDGANVDAHVYEGFTYDYYFKKFGRRGLDNHDVRINGMTHTVRPQDIFTAPASILNQYYINAFYCPTCGRDGRGMMVYGEGGGSAVFGCGTTRISIRNFAAAIDVVAHELTHGVTAYSSNLIYLNESGALNEAFSDIMGVSVRFFATPSTASYIQGEQLTSPAASICLSRSLQDPISWGYPDNYAVRFIGTADNGGVHINSSIANHAFYLAIEGGTNRTSKLTVQGVGAANREQIEKTFYRGFTQLLPSNATFSLARAATIQAARDLYGAGSAVERAVTQAWTAVGVN